MLMDTRKAILIIALIGLAGQRVLAQTEDAELKPPDLGILIGNTLLPGLLQTTNGEPEGYAYMVGGPLYLVGVTLQVDYLFNQADPNRQWELGTSLPLSEIGLSLESYSLYAFERDLNNRKPGVAAPKPREPYLSLLLAPYNPSNLFDPAVISVLGLVTIPSFTYDAINTMGSYFARSSVSFFGLQVSPVAGLCLESAFSLAINLFIASAEELIFRGVVLDRLGPTVSAISFGAFHLGNIFIAFSPSTTPFSASQLEAVGQQAAFALCFGVYANILTTENDYSLQKPITIHYWNNVFSMSVSYLEGNGIGGP